LTLKFTGLRWLTGWEQVYLAVLWTTQEDILMLSPQEDQQGSYSASFIL